MTENSPVLKDNFSTESQRSLEDKKAIILNLKVVRRDGSITPFKSEKISNAIGHPLGDPLTRGRLPR